MNPVSFIGLYPSGKRALVVDDYPINCEITRRCLENLKIRTGVSFSKKEAMEEIIKASNKGDAYDFVILDYRLGEDDGLQLCDEIAASGLDPSPMIIMVTGYGYFSAIETLAAHGVMGFMIKPFFPLQMEMTLKLILDGRLTGRPIPVVTRHTICRLMQDCPEQELSLRRRTFKGIRVLVVEDMPFNRLLLSKILSKFECIVETANNGIQAIEKWEKEPYDIILMDCQMPEMDGCEAAREIRKREARLSKHVPIIALTADAMSTDRDRCLQAGMDDHLGKPFRQEQIADIIKKVVRHAS